MMPKDDILMDHNIHATLGAVGERMENDYLVSTTRALGKLDEASETLPGRAVGYVGHWAANSLFCGATLAQVGREASAFAMQKQLASDRKGTKVTPDERDVSQRLAELHSDLETYQAHVHREGTQQRDNIAIPLLPLPNMPGPIASRSKVARGYNQYVTGSLNLAVNQLRVSKADKEALAQSLQKDVERLQATPGGVTENEMQALVQHGVIQNAALHDSALNTDSTIGRLYQVLEKADPQTAQGTIQTRQQGIAEFKSQMQSADFRTAYAQPSTGQPPARGPSAGLFTAQQRHVADPVKQEQIKLLEMIASVDKMPPHKKAAALLGAMDYIESQQTGTKFDKRMGEMVKDAREKLEGTDEKPGPIRQAYGDISADARQSALKGFMKTHGKDLSSDLHSGIKEQRQLSEKARETPRMKK